MEQESGSSKNNTELNDGKPQENEPLQGSSDPPSERLQQSKSLADQPESLLQDLFTPQTLLSHVLSWTITIILVVCIVLLIPDNSSWGRIIIAVLGFIGQTIFEGLQAVLKDGIKKLLPIRLLPIIKTSLPVIGSITICITLFIASLLTGLVQIRSESRPVPPVKKTSVVAPSPIATHPPLSPTPTDNITVTTRGNSQIGISDGRYVFDMGFADNVVKKQAAEAVHMHRYDNAQAILKEAQYLDPIDAEARIYQEDARIRASGLPHLTLVVVTTFKANDSKDQHETGASRDILQGACLAQLTYNSANPAKRLMLLIANVPDPQIDATTVARQIVQLAGQDHMVAGVIGWPAGSDDAIEMLGNANIPVVSPTSLDITSGAGGYFFSVAPSIDDQTRAAATYAKSNWRANKAAVFYDPDDPHSRDLDAAFINNFRKAGGTVISNATYSTDSPGAVELLRSANSLIAANPDLKFFYFAGYPSDARQLLRNINAHGIHVIAGDGLSQAVHCPVSVCPTGSLSNLYFTAAALQNEVALLKLDQQALDQQTWLQLKSADFFTAYQQQFDTGQAGNAYMNGERASSDVILAYDATSAFLYASQHIGWQISAQAMQQGLKNIQNIYGVSGHISFGSNGYPQQKAVLLLQPAANGLQLQAVPPLLGYY